MEEATEKRKLYDVAKCIAALLVVIAHATRMYTPAGAFTPANDSPVLKWLTDYIYIFHMPLFVFISGCVYGFCIQNNKYADNIAFLRGKARRLLLPYFFFGFAYVAPVMCLLDITQAGYWQYCLKGIVLSYNSRHLWYILALFWIFALAMVLKPLLRKGICGAAVIGCVSVALYLLSGRVPGYLQLGAACSYQIFFFAGILFNNCYKKFRWMFQKWGILFAAFPAALALWFVYNPNTITTFAYKGIGIGMILFLSWWIVTRCPGLLNTAVYRCIKENSFGIYLFHPMIVYLLFYCFGAYDIAPILLSVGSAFVSIVVSVGAAKAMRKVRLGVLIGE